MHECKKFYSAQFANQVASKTFVFFNKSILSTILQPYKVLIEFVESHSSKLELIGAHALYILNRAPLGVHDALYQCTGGGGD